MKRTYDTAFTPPNSRTSIPIDDSVNAPAPNRAAPTMLVPSATPNPIEQAGWSQATAFQGPGPASQPRVVSRGQATVPQQGCGTTHKKSTQTADVDLANNNSPTRLMLAARHGDLPTVQALLDNAADINLADKNGWTPLMFAAERGDLQIVQALLLASRIEIDARNNDGATALLVAAAFGKSKVVKALIDMGANINCDDQRGWTPLMFAAKDGNLTTVQTLLNNGANMGLASERGWTPLMFAAKQGHLTTVQALLLASSIKIDAKNDDGDTALLLATACGEGGVAKVLIDMGANLNVADRIGRTPLMWAAQHWGPPNVQVLLGDSLIAAATNGKSNVVKGLIDMGANVNFADQTGGTPLMFAAEQGHLTTVQALLRESSIEIDAKNDDGVTALLIATACGQGRVAKVLIAMGANLNVADRIGRTPLMWAAQHWGPPIVQVLLGDSLIATATNGKSAFVKGLIDMGADVNVADKTGGTPLMFAAKHGHLTTVQALLRAPGIKVDAKNDNGSTALIMAIRSNDDVVKALIEKNADVNLPNKGGRTPLVVSALEDNLECMQALLDGGADINADEGIGTPLMSAVEHDSRRVAQAILDNGADIYRPNEEGKTVMDIIVDEDTDEDLVANATRILLDRYLDQRKEVGGDLSRQATWASAFPTSALPLGETIFGGELPALEALIRRAQEAGPSLRQVSFQASRDRLLNGELSATQVVNLIGMLNHGPFAAALVQTLAVAVKLGAYLTEPAKAQIHLALQTSGLIDEHKKSKSDLHSKNINRWQVSGQTLLTRAAQAGDLPLVKALISCGANYRLPDQHGNNALHAAVKAGQWPVCSHLLALGANANTSDRRRVSTLTYLAQAFATGDEQTADFVATLLASLLAKGYRLDRVVDAPDDSEEDSEEATVTTVQEILQTDFTRYALYVGLLQPSTQAAAPVETFTSLAAPENQ